MITPMSALRRSKGSFSELRAINGNVGGDKLETRPRSAQQVGAWLYMQKTMGTHVASLEEGDWAHSAESAHSQTIQNETKSLNLYGVSRLGVDYVSGNCLQDIDTIWMF